MTDPSPALLSGLAGARESFLTVVDGLRPELHRYCARLTGSVIEGEDVVQETLAKAFYALSLSTEVPPLRPWLFRIAHNTALDFLKSHARKYVETRAELDDVATVADEQPDPVVVRAALSRFLALPVSQRSAVILKDVLGHSLEERALRRRPPGGAGRRGRLHGGGDAAFVLHPAGVGRGGARLGHPRLPVRALRGGRGGVRGGVSARERGYGGLPRRD